MSSSSRSMRSQSRFPGVRASSLGPEARLGRAPSPARLGPSFNSPSSTRGAMHPGEEKETMRGLNQRLSDYLNQVKLLEEANNQLEAQIQEVLTEKRAAGQKDWSGYERTLCTLRDQVKQMAMDNARLMLQIDNARLAADDFKVKLETETALRQTVEQDIANLRKIIDDTHVSCMQLEGEVESLAEELVYLKKNHEQDVADIQKQIRDANVDVHMEPTKGQDLTETIDSIRKQYEKVTQKNQEETQAWYQAKFENVTAEVSRNTDALQHGQSQLNDLRRQRQGLEIELQAMRNMNDSLEDTLNDTLASYSQNVNGHNMVIQQLEGELADVVAQVKKQGADYEALLNIKSKLEEEISTYYSLLDGTGLPLNGITDSGLPENGDFRSMGVRDNVNLKNTGSPDSANTGGNGLGDESVAFSLEQALSSGPRHLIPEPTINHETVEKELILQKNQEFNAANVDKNEALEEMKDDPFIPEETEEEEETINSGVETNKEQEEKTGCAVEDSVPEMEDEEVPITKEEVQVEESASPMVDTKLVELEKAGSSVVDAEEENVEEAATPVVDAVEEAGTPVMDAEEEKVEEATTPVVGSEEEKVEEAANPVVGVEEEKVKEAGNPVMDAEEEKVEEATTPVVGAEEEKVEEAANPVVGAEEEKVEEAATPPSDAEEKVEEAGTPVMNAEERVEKAGTPLVDAEVKEEVIPVVDAELEKEASLVVDTQVEEEESLEVDAQANEEVWSKSTVENNQDEEEEKGIEPENPEAEPLLNEQE